MITKDAKRIAIFGASGSGKSTLAKQLLKERDYVIVFDPLMEYAQRTGYVKAETQVELVRQLKRRWFQKRFHIAYCPRNGADYPRELHEISGILVRLRHAYFSGLDRRKMTLVVEEMNLSYPVSGLKPDMTGFRDLCSRGRHYGVEVIGISQRMAEVNTNFRGNASETYFLRLAEHNDLTAARKVMGPVWVDTLRSLPKFSYLKRSEDGRIEAGKVTRR
jgi:DNA helicase HerA-like ATPase